MKTVLKPMLTILALLAIPAFAAERAPQIQMQEQMHERMQKMQETMATIQQEKDPAKRAELMAQHMEEMREMHAGMGMGAGAAQQGMQDMPMEQRMQMMEQRMEMMQMTMGQMMEHEQQETEAPTHQHAQ